MIKLKAVEYLEALLRGLFIVVKAHANPNCIAPAFVYSNPVLILGTADTIGAKYNFPNVFPNVNAHISIIAIVGGATLHSIDDNTYDYNAAWQRVVKTHSTQGISESYVSFRIDFINATTGNTYNFDCFQLSFIGIDGDNTGVREFVAANNFTSYTVAPNTLLTITQTASGGLTQATGPLQNYPGIDTTAYSTNINFKYVNRNNVPEVRIGNKTNASFTVQNRFTCAYFEAISMPIVILPLKYLSFNGVVADNKVTLSWLTIQEVNMSHFEVERSFDMNNYSTIGLVLDGFESGNNKSYKFKDQTAELSSKSIVYYRLKQLDKDGKYSYSKVLAIRLQVKTDAVLQVSPNPFVENITARFNSTENGVAEIRLINTSGQTMISKQSTISKGYNNIQIENVAKLSYGIYFAQLVMNGVIIENQKVIKNK